MEVISVLVPTFNHEKYIERCVKSICCQKVDFTFEVIIGDDGSSDGTVEILDTIKNYYPNVKVVKQPKHGRYPLCGPNGRANILNLIDRAEGKFIAICDGDDFWIDEFKLQKQIELLNTKNVDFVADTTGDEGFYRPYELALLPSEKIVTSSILMKSELLNSFMEVCTYVPIGDWIWQLSTRNGGYLTEQTTYYNRENITSWTNKRPRTKTYWKCYYRNLSRALLSLFIKELRLVWLLGYYQTIKEQIQNGRF